MPPNTYRSPVKILVLALCAAFAPPLAAAQPSGEIETVVLSPFEIVTDRDSGYTAASALAGGRIDTALKDTPSAVSVLTREFMDDIAVTDFREISEWATNAVPNYDVNEVAFGEFRVNLRQLGSGFPSRNYFVWYISSDSYNVERFEYARGPNGVLFGDGEVGGIATTWTKRARFDRARQSLQLRADSYGGWRATVDVNQPIGTRAALRVNGLVDRGESWRDRTGSERDGVHVAGVVKLTSRNQLRFEGEWGRIERLLYPSTYGENASYWDGVTSYNGSPIPTVGTGVARISNNAYHVFAPGNAQAGLQNWSTLYQTTGTGFRIRPEGREDIANAPKLPSRKFNAQPSGSLGTLDYETMSAYLEHRFSNSLFAELAFNYTFSRREGDDDDLAGGYRIDINRVLPDGTTPNPKFGVPYDDVEREHRMQQNRVTDIRLAAAYRFEKSWIKQNFSFIGGSRMDRFNRFDRVERRVNGPNQNLNAAENIVRYRFYWDEPGRYEVAAPSSGFAGWDLQLVPDDLVINRTSIDYAQIASVSRLFNERLSVIMGARADSLYRAVRNRIGRDPVTNLPILGAPANAGQPAIPGDKMITRADPRSYNAGAVFFIVPSVGVYANYAETFRPPAGAGNNLIDGTPPGVSSSTGYDVGIKLELLDGRVAGSVGYYTNEQDGRIINGPMATQINRIWTNLNQVDRRVGYRDNESWRGTGYEIDLTANLTKHWRLTFNFALPETEQIDIAPGFRGYVATHLETWQAAAADTTNPNRGQIQNDLDAIQNEISGFAQGRRLNNTYDYTSNIYSTYRFEGGALKGWSFGGGANFRGGAVIGNTAASAFDYLYSEAYYVATAHVSYQRRFGKVQARFQLNISNLFDNDALITTNYGNYRVGGLNSNPVQQLRNAYRYLDPRKAVLSATFTF